MRKWKAFDDGLDYVMPEHQDEEHSMKKGKSRLNTVLHVIGGSIGRLLATATVVFAISVLFTMISTRLPNTKGVIEFKIKIDSLESQATAVVPGTEQIISTTITNDLGQPMYMFVRINCGTHGDGEKIYSFTSDDESWSVVDAGEDGQIVLAYTEGSTLKKVDAQDAVSFSGTLKCEVPVQYFGGWTDKDMIVEFDGFGISTEESDNPKTAYEVSVVGRGK